MLQRLRALEVAVSALRGQSRADRDRARLSALLPVIAAAVDDRCFTVGELLQVYRKRNSTLDRALAEQRIDSGRELGQLFARGAGVPIGELVLLQHTEFGRHREGRLWAVSVCIGKAQYTAESTPAQGCE